MILSKLVLIPFCLCLFLSYASAYEINDEARLHDYLFSSNYNPNLRPVNKSSNKILIETRLGIKRIFEMDEVNHRVVLFAVLFQKWNDDFLTWNPKEFGDIEYTYVDYSKIWTPQIQLTSKYSNEKSSPSDYSIHEIYDNFPVKLFHNGSVQFTPSVHLTSECLLNYGKFPLDIQMCLFLFQMPYSIDQTWLSLSVFYTKDEDIKYEHMWDIENFNSNSTIDDNRNQIVVLQLQFKRKYRNYLYTLPSYFVYILTLLMFILPQTSNQRIIIGSTCLIISCLLTFMMSNSTPNHEISAWPLLAKMFVFNIVLLTFSLLFSAFVINIARGDHLKSVPSWLRKLTINILARVFCIQAVAYTVLNSYSFKVHDDEVIAVQEHINAQLVMETIDTDIRVRNRNRNDSEEISESTPQESESLDNLNQKDGNKKNNLTKLLRQIYENIDQIRYRLQIDTYNSCKNNEWLLVGTLVDKILFFVYCTIVIISTFTILKQDRK
ncbi:unnamed protein product [Brachionus calyciflorus]|uniref:Uncharacterized protein n=1 Tax=Brachionus calyciflorus TaxID=104777 RepID=A0A813QJL5_9BILA|nr:unnamed protein product [Brachionus calyciflorus]